MQNNNPNNHLQEDELDLKDILKLLINSKKLIILITLVITILGLIYSNQKTPLYESTALIEIGQYDTFEKENITQNLSLQLLESSSKLVQDLNIDFIYRPDYKVNFLSIKTLLQDKLIKVEIRSPSIESGKKTLNAMVEYIENRHSNLLQRIANQLTYKIESLDNQIKFTNSTLLAQNEDDKLGISNQIESLDNQIEFTNSTLLAQNEDDKLGISNQIESLDNQIEFTNSTLLAQNEVDKFRISNQIESLSIEITGLDRKIKSLDNIIIADKNNLVLLESNPELFILRASQSPTLDQVIFSYKSRRIDYEDDKIKSLREKNNLENQLKILENSNLENEKIFKLSHQKDNLENQLKILENSNLENEKIFELSHQKDNLENQLKILENSNLENEKIFELSHQKDNLELELEFLMKQKHTNSQLIGEIQTYSVESKKGPTIFLSFIFGLLLSIVIVLINNWLKTLKEE